MKSFTDKKDADVCLAVFESAPLLFCPVINSSCRKDCICFQPAYIRAYYPRGRWAGPVDEEDIATQHYVYPNLCSHVLITGEIQINQ